MKLLEWSEGGTGDYRVPSFEVRYPDGSSISPVQYCGFRIFDGRYDDQPSFSETEKESSSGNGNKFHSSQRAASRQSDMPRIRSLGRGDARTQTLVISLVDRFMNLFVDLVYTVSADSDVLVRKAVIRNLGRRRAMLTRVMSMTLDMYASDHYLTHLSGAWAGERHMVTRKLMQGICYIESRRG